MKAQEPLVVSLCPPQNNRLADDRSVLQQLPVVPVAQFQANRFGEISGVPGGQRDICSSNFVDIAGQQSGRFGGVVESDNIEDNQLLTGGCILGVLLEPGLQRFEFGLLGDHRIGALALGEDLKGPR